MRFRFIKKKQPQSHPLLRVLSLKTFFHGPLPDKGFLFCVLGLVVFGWVMVYSSSALFAESRYQDQFFFLKRQILWSCIGAVAFLIAANTPSRFWQANTKYIFITAVIALVLVLFIGPKIAGARRWIRFGGVSFQPSELAKIAMIFLVSDYLDRRQSRLRSFKRGLLPLMVMVGGMLGLIVLEPDLGTPALMGGVFLSLLIMGGAQWSHLFLIGAASLPLLVLAVVKVQYRLKRLFAYLNPWSDAQGKGYQLIQSLLAMGSGGLFGQGLGESRAKISSLPDAHTDFVFSVLGEELGLMGTLSCTFLFFFLCMRGLKIAKTAPTFFSRLVGSGISLMIGFQALINMGVASGLFPTKGMTLPFISFGGSSLVIMMFSVGILAGISREGQRPSKAK